jgi:hypothetical protein
MTSPHTTSPRKGPPAGRSAVDAPRGIGWTLRRACAALAAFAALAPGAASAEVVTSHETTEATLHFLPEVPVEQPLPMQSLASVEPFLRGHVITFADGYDAYFPRNGSLTEAQIVALYEGLALALSDPTQRADAEAAVAGLNDDFLNELLTNAGVHASIANIEDFLHALSQVGRLDRVDIPMVFDFDMAHDLSWYAALGRQEAFNSMVHDDLTLHQLLEGMYRSHPYYTDRVELGPAVHDPETTYYDEDGQERRATVHPVDGSSRSGDIVRHDGTKLGDRDDDDDGRENGSLGEFWDFLWGGDDQEECFPSPIPHRWFSGDLYVHQALVAGVVSHQLEQAGALQAIRSHVQTQYELGLPVDTAVVDALVASAFQPDTVTYGPRTMSIYDARTF